MDWAVLLMAYGGPDSLDDIQPYLLDVRGGRETPPELVEEIRERYARIGGKSPLLDITRAQAAALEEYLNRGADETGIRFHLFVGMRHWRPYIHQAVEEIQSAGLNHVIAICMAPYYSKMSIGAYQARLDEALAAAGLREQADVRLVESWHLQPEYLEFLAGQVRAALPTFSEEERKDLRYLFTAHSLPAAIMQQGDPYARQLSETAQALASLLDLPEESWQLCYQSVGAQSTRWLGPTLEEVIEQLAADGHKSLLVSPIGFVADHVEILFDIDVEAREQAQELGLHLERTRSANAAPGFIRALAAIVNQSVQSWPVKQTGSGQPS